LQPLTFEQATILEQQQTIVEQLVASSVLHSSVIDHEDSGY